MIGLEKEKRVLELSVYDDASEVVLQFEHSLLSLSKWEAKHKIAFMSSTAKTPTQMIDYFQDMLLSPEVDRDLVYRCSPDQLDTLAEYINDPRSASKVPQERSRFSQEVITSELIYYWFTVLKIPFHPTETWHLNRIMMLVQIANFKAQPEKKRKTSEVMADWRAKNLEQQKKLFKKKTPEEEA